ncbi:MORN repeat-containing protein [Kiloniella majae]|uniref:MORN repeat-containing protein n=1 Tax=Kiloniella majae TaxID=1938558 RepID=UPI0015C5113C|nr:hypothetical protein [Kiloniella majae]
MTLYMALIMFPHLALSAHENLSFKFASGTVVHRMSDQTISLSTIGKANLLVNVSFMASYRKGHWVETNQQNCKIWNNIPIDNVSISWDGFCSNGYATGSGVAVWYKQKKPLNIIYGGFLKKGKSHGEGILGIVGLWTYDGNWVNGVQQGHGTITYQNGNTYTGDWYNGQAHGQGTYTWIKKKKKYSGEWTNDVPNGQGTMSYPDRDEIRGIWNNGCYNSLTQKAWIIVDRESCGF